MSAIMSPSMSITLDPVYDLWGCDVRSLTLLMSWFKTVCCLGLGSDEDEKLRAAEKSHNLKAEKSLAILGAGPT